MFGAPQSTTTTARFKEIGDDHADDLTRKVKDSNVKCLSRSGAYNVQCFDKAITLVHRLFSFCGRCVFNLIEFLLTPHTVVDELLSSKVRLSERVEYMFRAFVTRKAGGYTPMFE